MTHTRERGMKKEEGEEEERGNEGICNAREVTGKKGRETREEGEK